MLDERVSRDLMVQIRDVDPENRRDVATAAALHLALFRHMGPVAQLGEPFVGRFCYTVLLRDGLMRAALCEVDGRPAGLIAYTTRSLTFHRSAIRRHWMAVAWLVAVSVLRDPRVLLRLAKAGRLMTSRRSELHLGRDPLAEILAVGVLPEFRGSVFVRRTGLQLGELLLMHAAKAFRRAGLTRARVITDADNTAAVRFYGRLGGRPEPYELAGVPSVQFWFDLAAQLSGPSANGAAAEPEHRPR